MKGYQAVAAEDTASRGRQKGENVANEEVEQDWRNMLDSLGQTNEIMRRNF